METKAKRETLGTLMHHASDIPAATAAVRLARLLEVRKDRQLTRL